MKNAIWVLKSTGEVFDTEEVIRNNPNISFSSPFSPTEDYEMLSEVLPAFDPKTQKLIASELAVLSDGKWSRVITVDNLSIEVIAAALKKVKDAQWERIKAERDKRKNSGVFVGSHWFHSDADSRIQQLGLVMAGSQLPPGLQWKTLDTDVNGNPNFVTMTPTLALQIYQTTMLSDTAIFAAAETHRIAMESATDPENYDFSTNWPAMFQP